MAREFVQAHHGCGAAEGVGDVPGARDKTVDGGPQKLLDTEARPRSMPVVQTLPPGTSLHLSCPSAPCLRVIPRRASCTPWLAF